MPGHLVDTSPARYAAGCLERRFSTREQVLRVGLLYMISLYLKRDEWVVGVSPASSSDETRILLSVRVDAYF